MTPSCDGWYQYTFTGVSSTNLIFNNGNSGVGTNQTADLTANGTAYYDWATQSWLSTPPTISNPCLTVSPAGGNYSNGTNVLVNLKATDTTDANPVIYYTTNGTTPNDTSSSFVSNGMVSITTNTTLKAVAKNASGIYSTLKTETYNFTNAGITVYFKPDTTAAGWNGVTPKVYYWNVVGGSIPAATWPGVNMISDGNGWYKYTFPSVNSLNVIFNNGSGGVGTNQTPDITNVTSDIRYIWNTGILASNEVQKPKIVQLYPNPVKDILSLKSGQKFLKYAIYDGAGNLVEQKELNNNQINVSKFSTGMYYLKLLQSDGKIIFEQFIKE